MDTRSDLSSSPPSHIYPLLPASGSADVTVLFPYSSPPSTLFQGQTPLHHYTEMDNSHGGVRVQSEDGGVGVGKGRVGRQKGG